MFCPIAWKEILCGAATVGVNLTRNEVSQLSSNDKGTGLPLTEISALASETTRQRHGMTNIE